MRPAAMASALGVVLCLLTVGVRGQARGNARERSVLPIDTVVLTYTPASKELKTLRVPAKAPLPDGATEVLVFEPVSIEAGRVEMFRSCTANVQPVDAGSLQKVAAELRSLELLETSSARERIEVASHLAQLRLQQRQDEKDTERNDPYRLELQRQQERYADKKTIEQILGERNQAMSEFTSDVADMALAWSSVQAEKLSILFDQVKTLKPLVEQAKLAYQIKDRDLGRYRTAVKGWQRYSAEVVRALDPLGAGKDFGPVVVSHARKVCDGPSLNWDNVEITGPSRAGVSVIIAEASFDHGGQQLTYLRRLARTDRWAGRIDWPVNATRAALRVRWPGSPKFHPVADAIQTNRQSQTTAFAEAGRAVRQIEKKLNDSNFRAAGGDHIRTIPVF